MYFRLPKSMYVFQAIEDRVCILGYLKLCMESRLPKTVYVFQVIEDRVCILGY